MTNASGSPDLSSSEEYRQLAELLPDDFSNPADSVDEVRAKFDLVHGQDPGAGVVVENTRGVTWVRPDSAPVAHRLVVFLVHGGGFVTSTAESYAFYGAHIVRSSGASVCIPEYRLAPETVFPGQIEDLIAAWEALASEVDPSTVVFMGDSCGGGMALSTLLVARDRGLPLPGAFVGLCGWFDMEASGESATNPVGRDPLLNAEWLRLRARDYVGPDGDPAAPEVSPLHAELSGLPPALLHVGAVDRTRSDSKRLAKRWADAGGDVQLKIWSGMPHGFHGLAGLIPEADAALTEVAAFIESRISR